MTAPSPAPLRTAVAGIGGFAAAHHGALQKLEGEERVQVVATCDPAAPRLESVFEERQFAKRGVTVYEDFQAMMNEWGPRLDLVTVAAPIPLHAPMHQACIERGIPCYMEKPPTLNPEELEAMIALDTQARISTEVGFNFIYQPFRHELKKRIMAGEFGALRRISFQGLWPRTHRYYQRNSWAGRLLTDSGIITLDSCCGNAMAHHVHNILFFGGTESHFCWGTPREVEAELYRANAIQGTDTIFCRAKLENGVELRIAASHACDGIQLSREIIECENATLEIIPGEACWKLTRKGCSTPEVFPTHHATLIDNLRLYTDVVRGERPRPSTLLADCRGFVHLNALFYLAARRITTVPEPTNYGVDRDDSRLQLIENIDVITSRAIETGEFPSEQGLPWAVAGGSASAESLPQVRTVLNELVAS